MTHSLPSASGERMPLTALVPGETGQVLELATLGTLRRRLLNLGAVPGSEIEVVRRSPLGDPVAYRVRGAILALRNEEAEKLTVRRLVR